MRVKVYQINSERDKDRLAFMDSSILNCLFGSINPDRNIYDLVFDGDIPIREDSVENPSDICVLEAVYYRLNHGRKLEGYTGRSLSVSDIIEYNGKLYFCDSVGFKVVNWTT